MVYESFLTCSMAKISEDELFYESNKYILRNNTENENEKDDNKE